MLCYHEKTKKTEVFEYREKKFFKLKLEDQQSH